MPTIPTFTINGTQLRNTLLFFNNLEISTETSSRDLDATDAGNMLEATSGTLTFTIVDDVTGSFNDNHFISINNYTDNNLTIDTATGVSLNDVAGGSCTITGAISSGVVNGVFLYRRGTDDWGVQGDITGVT